jgi:hypothetical protein
MKDESFFKKAGLRRFGANALKGALILGASTVLMTSTPKKAWATCCVCFDSLSAPPIIAAEHAIGRNILNNFISQAFLNHINWLTGTYIGQNLIPAMMRMTEQLSAVGMQQVMMVGMFFDAKNQLETQRLYQELQAEAHKDYQPSEDFCWFGTNVRSMAASEQRGRANTATLSSHLLKRQLQSTETAGAEFSARDRLSRWQKFTKTYCDPKDNNWESSVTGSGLSLVCPTPHADKSRYNRDIDYTRLIDEPRTLDVDYIGLKTAPSADEEDVIALASNLYGHTVLDRTITDENLKYENYQNLYLAFRSVVAKRNVAENSFNAIVGLKSAGSSDTSGGAPKTREFLGAILTELGVPAAEVYNLIGERPSYYAQLEILAKKIYQNPDFYANLYDKPANVARKGVALRAIELMLDRAIFESQLRQEMAMSVLLSSRLRSTFRDVNKEADSGTGG